jgi:hypothetical protein
MSLPAFDSQGDLPEGVHRVTLSDVLTRFGVVRPAAILIGTLDEFVAHWQVKRDKTRRGIVEVIT